MLSQAVITELEKIDMNMRNVSDLAVLKSALLIMQVKAGLFELFVFSSEDAGISIRR